MLTRDTLIKVAIGVSVIIVLFLLLNSSKCTSGTMTAAPIEITLPPVVIEDDDDTPTPMPMPTMPVDDTPIQETYADYDETEPMDSARDNYQEPFTNYRRKTFEEPDYAAAEFEEGSLLD